MSQATKPPSPTFAREVLAYATEQGVSAYLADVFQMTGRIFPNGGLAVEIEDDPEIAGDRHLVIQVLAERPQAEQALDLRYRWHEGLLACCPAPLAHFFRLALRVSP